MKKLKDKIKMRQMIEFIISFSISLFFAYRSNAYWYYTYVDSGKGMSGLSSGFSNTQSKASILECLFGGLTTENWGIYPINGTAFF